MDDENELISTGFLNLQTGGRGDVTTDSPIAFDSVSDSAIDPVSDSPIVFDTTIESESPRFSKVEGSATARFDYTGASDSDADSDVGDMRENNTNYHKLDERLCMDTDEKSISKIVDRYKEEFNHYRDELDECYKITEQFIRDRQRILVGGMAIDFALRAVGDKLYDTKKIDYDFVSPSFHTDAYDLGNILAAKFDNISIIGARHVSTMRVRYKFMSIADITYVPPAIYDKIQFLMYEGIKIVHPHFQMVDQLRGLRNMAENPPMESYLSDRTEKDIKRFLMLSTKYKFEDIQPDPSELVEYSVDRSLFHGQCLHGYPAAIYWMKKTKLKSNDSLDIDKTRIVVRMPKKYRVSLVTDHSDMLYKKFPSMKPKYFNSFLDKLPKRTEFESDGIPFEVYDSRGVKHLAEPVDDMFIMGLYGTMTWLLIQYQFYSDKTAGCIFKHLWIALCTDFANKLELLPVPAKFYGAHNWSDSYLISLRKHIATMKGKKMEYLVPKNAYPKKGTTVPKVLYEFDPSKSEVFQVDAQACEQCETLELPTDM